MSDYVGPLFGERMLRFLIGGASGCGAGAETHAHFVRTGRARGHDDAARGDALAVERHRGDPARHVIGVLDDDVEALFRELNPRLEASPARGNTRLNPQLPILLANAEDLLDA